MARALGAGGALESEKVVTVTYCVLLLYFLRQCVFTVVNTVPKCMQGKNCLNS